MKPQVSLLVVDLDNTLYDWVTFFVHAFYAMTTAAASIIGVNEERLLDDMKEVHQRYGNSEQPFGLLEARCVLERMGHLDRQTRVEALADAFKSFNDVRDHLLCLYPGVLETLKTVKRSCQIVGHTEASVANAIFRLRKLQIIDLVNPLYALKENGPPHPRPERAREYATLFASARHLEEHERKPDTRVLLDICQKQGVAPEQTLYVGDSISRDVGMAKNAGVWAAWAKYGTVYDHSLWPRLVRVTHWTAEDVERAKRTEELLGHTKPDAVLARFDEILEHFDFVAPGARLSTP
jgi:FMN phosphatase YigB (HAD superfamily)